MVERNHLGRRDGGCRMNDPKVLTFEADPNTAALDAVEELRQLVLDGTITEFAVAGTNIRQEVTTLITPMATPFSVLGGLAAVQTKIAVKYVDSVRQEFAE